MRDLAFEVKQRASAIAALCLWPLLAVAAPVRPTLLAATIRLTPATLTFGSQVVGTSSTSQAVVVSNGGTSSLTMVKIAMSGDFSETDTCAGELPANASCTINITFKPTVKGPRRGILTVLESAAFRPHVIHLLGVGTQVKLSVDTLSFDGQPVHNPSSPKLVTLTNAGDTPLRIAVIRIAPPVTMWGNPVDSSVSSSRRADEFADSDGCGTSLEPGASCPINVTFTPRRAGGSTAWLIISDDGGGSPQRVTLWGVGLRQ